MAKHSIIPISRAAFMGDLTIEELENRLEMQIISVALSDICIKQCGTQCGVNCGTYSSTAEASLDM